MTTAFLLKAYRKKTITYIPALSDTSSKVSCKVNNICLLTFDYKTKGPFRQGPHHLTGDDTHTSI